MMSDSTQSRILAQSLSRRRMIKTAAATGAAAATVRLAGPTVTFAAPAAQEQERR